MMALSGLTNMKMGPDNSTIVVGPGMRWIDVYEFLEPYG